MPSKAGRYAAIFISATLFALIHLSRGPLQVVWASMVGLIMASYYCRFGRVLPLILAHYLSNALQVMLVVLIFGKA